MLRETANKKDTDEVGVLYFCDNGIGLSPKKINALISGRSQGKKETATGSFGVGHLTAYYLSNLGYVLYASRYKENGKLRNLFTGSPVIAGHESDGGERIGQGRILAKKPNCEMKPKFQYPDKIPPFLANKLPEGKTGTVVAALALNEKAKWEDAEYAIAANFFPAIMEGKIKVVVHKDDKPMEIDKAQVKELLFGRKDEKQAKDEYVLGGKDAWQCWQTKLSGKQEKILLSNKDEVAVTLWNDRSMSSVIAVVRNGMLIARHDKVISTHLGNLKSSDDVEPFTAIINVDHASAPVLYKLVRGAEGPNHNRLIQGQLSGDEEKTLSKLFGEIADGIKEKLPKINRDSHALRLFATEDEESDSEEEGIALPGGAPLPPVPNPMPPMPPDPNPRPEPPDPNPPHPPAPPRPPSRRLKFYDSFRYDIVSKTELKVEGRVKVAHNSQQDEVYFSLLLAEDNDNNRDMPNYLNFIGKVSISPVGGGEEKAVAAPANNTRMVNLGVLVEGVYFIRAKVARSAEFSGKPALQAFFNAKRLPSKPKQGDEQTNG